MAMLVPNAMPGDRTGYLLGGEGPATSEWIRDSLRRMLDRMERLGDGMREVREHVVGEER